MTLTSIRFTYHKPRTGGGQASMPSSLPGQVRIMVVLLASRRAELAAQPAFLGAGLLVRNMPCVRSTFTRWTGLTTVNLLVK